MRSSGAAPPGRRSPSSPAARQFRARNQSFQTIAMSFAMTSCSLPVVVNRARRGDKIHPTSADRGASPVRRLVGRRRFPARICARRALWLREKQMGAQKLARTQPAQMPTRNDCRGPRVVAASIAGTLLERILTDSKGRVASHPFTANDSFDFRIEYLDML